MFGEPHCFHSWVSDHRVSCTDVLDVTKLKQRRHLLNCYRLPKVKEKPVSGIEMHVNRYPSF